MARSNFKTSLVTALFILSTGVAGAGGHGEQKVCDQADLIGSAYGACNVYCEALDCDGPPNPRRERACERALDRFIDLTGDVPPCVPLCPCAAGWRNPEFVPDFLAASECSMLLGDGFEVIELRLDGYPDENGAEPLSRASVYIGDDDVEGFHGLGCLSERYDDRLAEPSEDSGFFDMSNSFRVESDQLARQRNDIFTSCKAVMTRFIEENGIECVVDDVRSQ